MIYKILFVKIFGPVSRFSVRKINDEKPSLKMHGGSQKQMAQKGIEKRGHGKAAVNDQKKGRPPNGTLFWILPWRKSNVPVSWQHGKEVIRIPPTE